MKRLASTPRPDWKSKVEQIGLTYHSHANGPYWDESVSYQLTAAEVDALEAAANTLHFLCIDAAEAVIKNNWWDRFAIPPSAVPVILRSWDRDDFSLYGRFDLAFDGVNPPKLLEYNADTPTALLEASIAQWFWLQDIQPNADQFNSIHERLIAAWRRFAPSFSSPVHFASMPDSPEDEMTVLYLRDTCVQAGLETKSLSLQDIGWDAARACFVDLDLQPIKHCFKLYPWEWLWRDDFACHLQRDSLSLIEPAWKMLLSNKALLSVLWELFPGHPNLLPAADNAAALGDSFVRKPILSREGSNVLLVEKGAAIEEVAGPYAAERSIFQALAPNVEFDGFHPVFGLWVVDHAAAGLGIREDSRRITGNLSRFVPHFFPMISDNPTQISVGMEARFFNRRYSVIGRAVLGTFDNGLRCLWHEYYLETSGGSLATLVFEKAGNGPVWRWFSMFDPTTSFSPAEIAAKKIGDTIHIDNERYSIRRVSQSRIYYTEGRTPEGVAVNQTANYFNAAREPKLLVVSWTGDELEFYRGFNIPVAAVASAFGFGALRRIAFTLLSGRTSKVLIPLVVFLLLIGIPFFLIIAAHSEPDITVTAAPAPALHIGDAGVLLGVRYHVGAASHVQIDQVSRRYGCQEFDLLPTGDGQPAELIQEPHRWLLCRPIHPSQPLQPLRAGSLRAGDSLSIDQSDARVNDLFRKTVLDSTGLHEILYGLTASNNTNTYTLEWSETNIAYWSTTPIPTPTFK